MYIVEVVTFMMDQSFNSRVMDNNFQKALSGILAYADNQIFNMQLSENEAGEINLDVGNWLVHNGMLYRDDDERLPLLMDEIHPVKGEDALKFALGIRQGLRPLHCVTRSRFFHFLSRLGSRMDCQTY